MPAPAPVSTMTRWPRATSSRTEPGISPTRYSWVLISLGTPTSTGSGLFRLVEIMDLEQGAAAVRLERPMRCAGRSAGIGALGKILAAAALRVVADRQIALEQIDLLPIFMDERGGGVNAGLEAQQPRPAAAVVRLVEAAGQDLFLDARRIARDGLPARGGVDLVEFLVLLADRHRGASYSSGSGWMR